MSEVETPSENPPTPFERLTDMVNATGYLALTAEAQELRALLIDDERTFQHVDALAKVLAGVKRHVELVTPKEPEPVTPMLVDPVPPTAD